MEKKYSIKAATGWAACKANVGHRILTFLNVISGAREIRRNKPLSYRACTIVIL